MTTEVIIDANSLQMSYGDIQALSGVSFQIHKGEIIGLLGPNGAGKSTIIKILTTYLYPTGGSAHLLGYDIFQFPEKIREKIGYLPENTPLYLDMSAESYLSFVGRARGLKGASLAK
ncbi:MAG: ATP-binding cassette domain-containing protein, partial [Planctomycetota bacterium]